MNTSAWFQGSGMAANAVWWTVASIGLALSLFVLGRVVLGLFDRVVWADMDRERAFRYGVRAVAAIALLCVLFKR
jgi:hypothetical protein